RLGGPRVVGRDVKDQESGILIDSSGLVGGKSRVSPLRVGTVFPGSFPIRVGGTDVERPEVLGFVIDVGEFDRQHQAVLPVANNARRGLAVGGLVIRGSAESVGGQVVAGEAGRWRAGVVLNHAELVAGAADAVADPGGLEPGIPGAANRATVARPAIAPARHQLDGPAL